MEQDRQYLDVALSLGVIERDFAQQVVAWLQGKSPGAARAQLLGRGVITAEQDRAILDALSRAAAAPPVAGATGAVSALDLTYLPANGQTAPNADTLLAAGSARRGDWKAPADGAASATWSRSDKFQPVRELGKGGMGVVELHADAAIGREVAIKTLLRAGDPAAVRRFIEEGQVTGQLEHPNIVPVYDLNRDESNRPYLVMKCVRGRTLAEVLDGIRLGALTSLDAVPATQFKGDNTETIEATRGNTPRTMRGSTRLARVAKRGATRRAGSPVPPTAAHEPSPTPQQWLTRLLDVFLKVCDAMAFAHARGVIHRDLKPENIMVGRFGEVLVMDWGLAKVLGRDKENAQADHELSEQVRLLSSDEGTLRTQEGSVAGTPMYMPPEQAEGRIADLDQRSDVYSLGAVLFEILALHEPFSAANVYELLGKVVRGRIEPPRQRSRAPWSIPRELQAIALKAMSRQPGDRYATADQLKSDIEAFRSNTRVSAVRDNPFQALAKWSKRHPTASTSGMLAVLFLLLGGLLVSQLVAAEQTARRETAERDRAETVAELATADASREAAQHAEADERAERKAAEAILARAAEAAARNDLEQVQSLLIREGTDARDAAIVEFRRLWTRKERHRLTNEAFVAEVGVGRLREFLAAYVRLIDVVAPSTGYKPTGHDLFYRAFLMSYLPEADLHAVIAGYDEALRVDPTLWPAYGNRGHAYSKLGQNRRALKDYDEAIRLAPELASGYISRSYIHLALDQYQQAIDDCTAAIDRDPLQALAYNNRGNGYLGLGEPRKAIAEFDEAIRLEPDLPIAHNNRGSAYYSLAEYKTAIGNFDEAIRLDPDLATAFYNRGNSYRELGDVRRAIEDYEAASRLDPDNVGSYINRGLAYQAIGEPGRALEEYNTAIGMDPNNAEAYVNRARSYVALGEFDRALADCDAALRIDSEMVAAYSNRGAVYQHLGEIDLAIEDYDAAIRLDPNSAIAYNNRGAAYGSIGELDRAIEDYSAAIEADPTYGDAYVNRGNVRAQQGDAIGAAEDRATGERLRGAPTVTSGRYAGEFSRTDRTVGEGRRIDAYVFAGVRGQRVTVVMRSRAFVCYVAVQGAGVKIYSGEREQGVTDTEVTLTLPADGMYIVYCTTHIAELGAYELELQIVD